MQTVPGPEQPSSEPEAVAPQPEAEGPLGHNGRLERFGLAAVIGLAAWASLVLASRLVGLAVIRREPRAALSFPPLAVRYDPRWNARALVPIVVGIILLVVAPAATRRLRWPTLLLGAFIASLVWALALAQVDGLAGLTGDGNYLDVVPLVHGPGAFLSTFVDMIGTYTQHVRAHPPGMVLLLWAMRRIGLGGSVPEGLMVAVAGCAAIPAVLIAAREVAGEGRARAAAPFVALAPAVIWVATTADAVYAGVGAWAVALMILATGRVGRRSDALALAGGLLFGAGLFLTYGLVLLGLIPIVVALARKRIRSLMVAGAGVASVVTAFALAGFWWLDGLRATLVEYHESAAQFRPQSAFWLVNLGAFAIALGPAVGPLLARLQHRPSWLLVGAALAAVALADATGLSKAEVERIWLPFVPWVLLASASMWTSKSGGRGRAEPQISARWLLALQLLTALAIQLFLFGP